MSSINSNVSKLVDIRIGDCIEVMKKMKDQSIDVIITSPPYWGLRDYDNSKQWGNEEKYQDFIEKMKIWATECLRILKNTGSLFLNIGDKYHKKGLMLIPERIAIAMSDNGWILRNTLIWNKPNHMPSSVKDRFCNSYEFVYFFVKDSKKYYNYSYYVDIDVLRIKPTTKPSKINETFPNYLSIEEYEDETFQKKMADYNKKKNENYTGKFKGQTINKGKSPGARQSNGIQYSLQRKEKLTKQNSLHINQFLNEALKKKNINTKKIDLAFGYKDSASHWFRVDPGRSLPKPEDWFKLKKLLDITETKYDAIMTEQHYVLQNVKNNPKGKTPPDILNIPTEKCRESHYAIFPTELPRTIIKAFCPPDGIVLDTFGGSGTTAIPCIEQNKKCILIDCNPEFEAIIKTRCEKVTNN